MSGAACSEGCARELPVTVARADAPVEVDELEAMLWPNKTKYKLAPIAEIEALERLVSLLFERAKTGSLSPRQARQVSEDAEIAGVELHDLSVEVDGRVVQLWVVVEQDERRRGWGSYLFRVGRLERPPGRPKVDYVLEAPHSHFDRHTGAIALRLLVERPPGVPAPRALLTNDAHRHRQLDGAREQQPRAADNPADAAHREDHPLARTTARLLEDHAVVLIQLHGYGREPGDPDVIVSAGTEQPSDASRGLAARLSRALAGLEVRHFGVDAPRLGGETNVQGAAARGLERCFLHIEMTAETRDALVEDAQLRARMATALFGGSGGEWRACKEE